MSNLFRCLSTVESNGFGFQADHADPQGTLIIAQICKATANGASSVLSFSELPSRAPLSLLDLRNELQQQTGSTTIDVLDWLDRIFLSIHCSEWALIPAIFEYLLDQYSEIRIRPQNKLRGAVFRQGDTFSWDEMERKAIAHFEECANLPPRNGSLRRAYDVSRPWQFKKHWNWHSAAGKTFCSCLRLALGRPPEAKRSDCYFLWPNFDALCREQRILHRGDWSAYEPSMRTLSATLLPLPVSEPLHTSALDAAQPKTGLPERDDSSEVISGHRVKRQRFCDSGDEESEPTCMICLESLPNTLVTPCGHVVVCNECSDKLRETGDRAICVRCRRPIDGIHEDGKEIRFVQR